MNQYSQVQHLVKQGTNIKKLHKSGLIFLAVLAALLATKPAMALGEYFSSRFSSVATYRWIYLNMTSQYANAYVIPAGAQWNGISSRVNLTRVTSGSYIVNAQVATSTNPSIAGLMTAYCSSGSGDICLDGGKTWSSARIYGFENVMAANSYTTAQRINVFTHDGHTLSMDHVTNGSAAVMVSGRSNLGVQVYDKANLKAKWGN